MSDHNVYHIVPRNGRWAARLQGSPTVSLEADSRSAALEGTEAIVRQLGDGRIVLHGEGGAIESVHTFEQIVDTPNSSWTDALRSAPFLVGMAAVCLVGVGFALRGRR